MAGRNRHKCAGSTRLFCHDEQARPFLPSPPTQPRRLQSPAAALPSSLSARACSSLLLLVLAVVAGGPLFPPPAPAGLVRFGGFAAWLPAGPPKGPLLRPLVAFRPVWFTGFVCAFRPSPSPGRPPLPPCLAPPPCTRAVVRSLCSLKKGGLPGAGAVWSARALPFRPGPSFGPLVPPPGAPLSQPGPARKGRIMGDRPPAFGRPPLRGAFTPLPFGLPPPPGGPLPLRGCEGGNLPLFSAFPGLSSPGFIDFTTAPQGRALAKSPGTCYNKNTCSY